VIRCQGEDNQPRCFSTWAAIALAGIGKLPATLADRSIEIKLKRKTTNEPAQRLDRHARGALGELARKIARWALDNRAKVQSAEPVLLGALDDRRQRQLATADGLGRYCRRQMARPGHSGGASAKRAPQ